MWRNAVVLSIWLALSLPAFAQTPGLTPITDVGTGTYNGYVGGLYPNGSNLPPAAHLDAALRQAAQIFPRDSAGNASSTGVIVMLSIGMSNTNQEFSVFERNEDQDANRD